MAALPASDGPRPVRSVIGFVIVLFVGLVALGAIALGYSVGAGVLVGGCLLVLMLPLGLDTRLAGWLVACALPTAFEGLVDHRWWLLVSACLLATGLGLLVVALSRGLRDEHRRLPS